MCQARQKEALELTAQCVERREKAGTVGNGQELREKRGAVVSIKEGRFSLSSSPHHHDLVAEVPQHVSILAQQWPGLFSCEAHKIRTLLGWIYITQQLWLS